MTHAKHFEFLNRLSDALAQRAYQQQGAWAFGGTRRTAAIHESGHAVIAEATACPPRLSSAYRLTIQRDVSPDRDPEFSEVEFWSGYTAGHPKTPRIQFNVKTEPAIALVATARFLAGVVAEQLFATNDWRKASSIDEIAIAIGICKDVALLHDREMMDVYDRVFGWTAEVLDANRLILLAIAARLERDRKVNPHDLRQMLAKVKRMDWMVAFLV